ncbi:hypothetical protein A9798_15405 [Edwardsiella hoshinae]|uniref:Uncharacterized protein n=2 Tax=Edwardsiella hoshinae TaxID=93378 RepID=A0ABM6EMG5_9GAMM|nr:hypothetical protein A9798_15405 [Edwardsiella hoshinae]
MKTTLKALALVTAAGVSGITNAATPTWVDGTTPFNNTFTASGTVLGKEFSQKWQWAVGPGLPNLQGALSQATSSNGNKIIIPVTQDTPILVGKTAEAFAVPETFINGGVGAMPNIAFKNGGQTATLGEPTVTGGSAFITIDVKDSSNAKIGTAKLNVITAGIEVVGKSGHAAQQKVLYAPNRNSIFRGGLPVNGKVVIKDVAQTAATVMNFGGLSQDAMKLQVGASSLQPVYGNCSDENMAYDDGTKVSASYALGFKAGNTIEVTFDNGHVPSTTTQWTASLGIQVTYV